MDASWYKFSQNTFQRQYTKFYLLCVHFHSGQFLFWLLLNASLIHELFISELISYQIFGVFLLSFCQLFPV